MRSICVLFAALLSTPLSFADPVTYNYVGNNYNTIVDGATPSGTAFNTGMRITGSLTFSAPLADQALGQVTPVSFSFSNGAHTFTEADTLVNLHIYLQIAGGVITGWDIQFNDQFLYVNDPIGKQENTLYTKNMPGNVVEGAEFLEMTSPTTFGADQAFINGSPGVWAVAASAVPEPGSLALAGLALLGLAGARRARPAR